MQAFALTVGLSGALACALAASPALATTPSSSVQLDVAATCDRIDATQLRRLLDIERRSQAGARVGDVSVSVRCEQGTAILRLSPLDGRALPRERRFALTDVSGEVGARVLSLAAIELSNDLAAAEVAPAPAPLPEPERPAPPERSALAREPSVRLMAAGALYTFALGQPLAGGGISVDYLRLARLALRLELDVAVAGRSYELGKARLQLTTLSAQGGYLALHEHWSARVFAGYRFGSARIAGERAPGSLAQQGTVTGACGGPLLSTGFGVRSGAWVGELGAEVGLVSFPLEGWVEAADPIRFDGYWLALSLNIGALL